MKIYHLKNVEGFLEVLDQCKGTVELVSKDGDRLNLKSKLSQYVGLSKLFKEARNLDLELEIFAHEPEDADRLFHFLMEGV
ncbi:polya polymerase [Paenibacillus planticolens]|uniref:Polya polymerase n=1 Tax=Paenibacillus planticolens TaxID=2654976 RepID=A0ABX1ZM68_9BACL|nr:polya polymerase [Paenibacillus planticolens]NOV01179.1 polya polymerase [Paenibacillus planticolens]